MTPVFDTVPEHWRHPVGPYRQAPQTFGGQWWLVNPFTGPAPWSTTRSDIAAAQLPAGFVELFGSRPRSQDYHSASNPSLAFRSALAIWEQELQHFKQAGYPEWATPDAWLEAVAAFEYWGMGRPQHYEGRYGWTTRFPQSAVRDFESMTWTALNASQLVIAQYQLRLLDQGVVPSKRHPFVPPIAWPQE